MNHSILMALSYVFGQGLYFIALAYLLYTGQKDVAGWLSVKLAYLSFIFQLSDLGTLNIIARAWNEKREKDIDELVLIRGLYSFIAGIIIAIAAYHLGEHDVYFVSMLPLVCAMAGFSRLFEYELRGEYFKTAIMQSTQWIFILVACAIERFLFDSGGIFLFAPVLIFYLIKIKFNRISIKLINASTYKDFAPIFLIGIAGQLWGRLIVQLIYSHHGPLIVSIYSLTRGVLAGLIKLTTNFIRPLFFSLVTKKSYSTPKFITPTIALLALSQFSIIAILFFCTDKDEAVVLFLWPLWTIYTWQSMQWLYLMTPKKILIFEILCVLLTAWLFIFTYCNNPYFATFISDAVRFALMAMMLLYQRKINTIAPA